MVDVFLSRSDELADAMLASSWVAAIATIAGVLVAGGALVGAAISIRQTGKQMREAADREAADSEARTRPYVSARIVVGIAGSPSLDLVVENRGRSTARSIRLVPSAGRFDPYSTTPALAKALEAMLTTGFDLVPGERRRVFWHVEPVDTDLPREKQPPSVRDTLTLTYEWHPDDASQPIREYREDVRFDMTDYVVAIPSPATGATSPSLSGMEREVRDLAHAVRAVAQHIGESYR